MSLNGLRSWLYRLASLLGDINAARRGKLVERIVRKEATKAASRTINKIVR